MFYVRIDVGLTFLRLTFRVFFYIYFAIFDRANIRFRAAVE